MKLLNNIRHSTIVRDTRGLSTVEYVIVLCLIAAVCVGTWKSFGGEIHSRLTSAKDRIGNALKN